MNKELIKQVAEVIGKELAIHELSLVCAYNYTDNDAVCVYDAFIWEDTPQGEDFWHDINIGRWPYNYTRGKSNE